MELLAIYNETHHRHLIAFRVIISVVEQLCMHDSGAPLLDPSGAIQYGIASFGPGPLICATGGKPDGYTVRQDTLSAGARTLIIKSFLTIAIFGTSSRMWRHSIVGSKSN